MRKIYNEFFRVSKHWKISEKVMLTRVITAVTVIVMCLGAMGITAYAYFSLSITSGSNVIKTANFETLISITESDSSIPATVVKIDNLTYTAELKAGKTYTVTLYESEGNTAKTGFCVISAKGCEAIYHTQQLGNDENVEGGFTDKITFQLKATGDTTVTFLSHWGTSSYYTDYKNKGELYITNGNVDANRVVMIINGVSEADCDAKIQSESVPTIQDYPSAVTQGTVDGEPSLTTENESGTSAEPTSAQNTESEQNS